MSRSDAQLAVGTVAVTATLLLTWTFTETYTHPIGLDAVARSTGRDPGELAADPWSLLGAVGDPLADLLTSHQSERRVIGEPEVEITAAEYPDPPTVGDLVDAARNALQAEAAAGRPSDSGRALAALLAVLHREGITDR